MSAFIMHIIVSAKASLEDTEVKHNDYGAALGIGFAVKSCFLFFLIPAHSRAPDARLHILLPLLDA